MRTLKEIYQIDLAMQPESVLQDILYDLQHRPTTIRRFNQDIVSSQVKSLINRVESAILLMRYRKLLFPQDQNHASTIS
jgi:hypothetical protein